MTEAPATHAPSVEGALRLPFLQKRKKGKFREIEAPRLPVLVADTHAHLEMLEDPAANLARCAYYGVSFVCAMADPTEDADTTLGMIDEWLASAEALLADAGLEDYIDRLPDIRVAMGCHPHNAKDYDDALEAVLVKRLKDPRICALGEVGLDYHYDLSPRDVQREVFRRQIRLAKEAGLPLILHMREAHDEGFALLKEEGFPEAGVLLHCFNLDASVLKPWADEGCYVAYGGPLTFKNADEVREGAQHVALDRLLTETDSPYMTPEPMRGMECGPEHVVFTAAKLAEVRACQNEEEVRSLLDQVHRNARSLLDREPTDWQRS
ncbi:MAG: TatD family hydrolase [Eggerthellaceae bacterium]